MASQPEAPAVADLNDAYGLTVDSFGTIDPDLYLMDPILKPYGGKRRYAGPAATLKMFDHNTGLRPLLLEEGNGRVLVIDNGGSARTAVMGEKLANLALKNGWAGFVINGYVRDTMEMKDVNIGMHAIGAFPRKPGKKLPGQTGLTLNFGGVTISPGDWVYADEDGILISRKQLQWPKVA